MHEAAQSLLAPMPGCLPPWQQLSWYRMRGRNSTLLQMWTKVCAHHLQVHWKPTVSWLHRWMLEEAEESASCWRIWLKQRSWREQIADSVWILPRRFDRVCSEEWKVRTKGGKPVDWRSPSQIFQKLLESDQRQESILDPICLWTFQIGHVHIWIKISGQINQWQSRDWCLLERRLPSPWDFGVRSDQAYREGFHVFKSWGNQKQNLRGITCDHRSPKRIWVGRDQEIAHCILKRILPREKRQCLSRSTSLLAFLHQVESSWSSVKFENISPSICWRRLGLS